VKYQLTCPKCHYEFTYDNGYIDKNIVRLGCEIRDIINQLAEHNLLPKPEQKARTDWWKRAKKSLAEKQKELAELKAIRKVSDQQIKGYEYQIFKNLTKELVGETEYKKLIEKMQLELEAYQVSGLMRHEYTRSNSQNEITSTNKI
jgi:hypothetical protein